MIDVCAYRGLEQFGKAYRIMLENDTHVPGSIDRVLMGDMIQLRPETVEYLYGEYTPKRSLYIKGMRPKIEQYAEKAVSGCQSDEERVGAIVRFTASLPDEGSTDLDSMRFGGIEEDVIARGSDLCTDVARVGCVLNQVIGLPSRIVYLFNTEKAYTGHAIVEVYRANIWGAVDPLTNVVYHHPGGKPASVWDLIMEPGLVECHWRGEATPYTVVEQFGGVGISNYFIWRWKEYDYTVSRINDYYRSILEMAEKGWPGGLRWLHAEDIN